MSKRSGLVNVVIKNILTFQLLFLSPALCFSQNAIEDLNACATENIHREDFKGALEAYDQIIALSPKDSFAYFNRGLLKYDLKDFTGAEADFTKAIDVDPSNPDHYFLRGLSRDKLKKYREAIPDFDKILSTEKNNADAYFFRGVAKFNTRDKKGALADLTESIRLRSDHSEEATKYCEQLRKNK